MGVVVKKSPPVMVRPFEQPPPPPTRVAEKLSSFDKSCIKSLVTSFLVFEHPIPDTADTIKRALSQALVYYNPFAGRIAVAGDGEIHVRCHSEGAAFVAASADCTLKDATLLDLSNGKRAAALLNELAVVHYREAEGCLPTDPLLMMQVTEFTCGGFVLGVTWNHGIADGVGLAQFLQAVGELARGSPSPSVVPVRGDASLPSLLPESTMQIDVWIPEPLHLVCLDVSIPSSLINRIKASFRDRSGGQPCTTFDTVAAVLWQCRTRAIVSDPGSIALLSFAINVRKHVGAKDGYYGNCITMQDVTATSAAVVNADIVDLVKMIKLAKDEFQLFSNNEGFCKVLQETDQQQRDQLQYNTLLLSSWRNIGFEEADFGGGTPAKVMGYMPPLRMFPACVVGLPCKWKDGPSNVFSACVKKEHADAFVAELARLNA